MQEFRGFPVSSSRVPLAGRTFELLAPAGSDDLVDSPAVVERFADDEYLPYWSQLWPAGLLLADAIAAWGPCGDDPPRVLELGCGLGLASLVLSHLGYRVVASDYDEDALAFVAENARRNRVRAPETRYLDWREPVAGLSFDRIVAADVLYETRNLRPVAEFLHDHLETGGFALIADPNRMTAEGFDKIARHCGLSVRITAVARPDPSGGGTVRGRLFELRRKT